MCKIDLKGACQMSALILHAKVTKVALRRNKYHFSTLKALSHFGIHSNTLKLIYSNMCLSQGPEKYDKKAPK